jgi:hypothetical protein
VAPIFQARCVSCHGAKSPAEGLDLSSLVGIRRGSAGGTVIELGSPDRSRLLLAVTPHGGKATMPPGQPLSPDQIETLREWIRQGASWAETPPLSFPVPRTRQAGWARNPVDSFVLSRLEREGLAPSAEADKVAAVRRVRLVLTGVPPKAEQVNRFVADRRRDAYERLVEVLLAGQKVDPVELARWKASQSDPIQRRAEVNRVWARLFGRGIADAQGVPSHPELLDWLTIEGLKSGWDIKALERLIVSSGTYRQSSKATKELLEWDPKNRLLARGPGV